MAARGSKRVPRWPQEGPRCLQDGPKRGQDEAIMDQDSSRYPKLNARRLDVKNQPKPKDNYGFWRVQRLREVPT